MDNEMIERVAKAICKSGKFETGQGTCAILCMDQLGDARNDCQHAKHIHEKLAVAAIKAMREPTEKMCSIDAPDMPGGGEVSEIWQSMIDAILND